MTMMCLQMRGIVLYDSSQFRTTIVQPITVGYVRLISSPCYRTGPDVEMIGCVSYCGPQLFNFL